MGSGPTRRRAGDGGQVLMLAPAAVLVMVLLAAIAVDSSVAFLARRELSAAADAAANDAVTYGLRQVELRGGRGYALDQGRMEAVARQSVEARRLGARITRLTVRAVSVDEVEVAITGEASLVFAKAIPGAPDVVTVQARARAAAVRSEAAGDP